MITYPYDYYFSEDSVQTDIVITDGTASYSGTSLVVTGNTVLFTNENIDSEKMSLLETLCSDNTLRWGRCEASELKFTIHSSVVPLEGTVLNVYLYFNNDASTLFKIGTYKVDSDVATALRTVREITCYDALLDVLNTDYIDWYNALDFDTVNTIKKFRDAFFTHIGITQKTTTLVNDSATIVKVAAETLSGTQILNAICEINGRFGHIDRDNEFAYVKLEQNIQGLYPAVDLYPSPTLYPRQPKSTPIATGTYIPPLRYEKYKLPSITRLQIRTDDSDIGVVVGTVGTDYVIQGNFLTFNLTGVVLTGIANNILGEISGVVFQPFEVQMRANLCFEVGDAIRCNDDLTGVEGYILYRNAVGIQAIIDTLNCMKERDYKLDANSVGYQFNAVNNKTATLKQDVDGVSTELTEQLALDGIVRQGTYAEQTNTKFSQKVSVEYGNHTTDSFSWDMDITGHTWYKDDVEVMKIDGNGLSVKGSITAGSTITGTDITGSSFSTSDSGSNKTTIIDDGSITIKKGNSAAAVIDLNWQTNDVNITAYAGYALAIGAGNGIQFNTADDIVMNTNYHGIYIGVNSSNTVNTEYVGIDGRTWVHVGANTPSVTIGNSASSSSTTIKGDTLTLDADTTYIGANSDISLNPIYIGHSTSGGHTGSYVEINGYQVRLNGTVYINGSTPSTLSISDVESDLRSTYGILTSGSGTTSDCTSLHLYLNSYDQLVFHSKYAGGSHISLNTIIVASGATKTSGLN